GFFAKAYVILAAVQASDAGWTSLGILAVIAVLNAAAAAFYYLRVVVYMFMREPRTEGEPLSHGRLLWGGLVAATVLTIVLGLIPGPLFDVVGEAARAIG
ncbi:MAG: NADH-quinone oxidoreductase subunit N, partial [Chloroflexi bacterium]|nr:NADH-quinone oxidoreductase subunit N [Chloroflexota bacterium]